MNLDLIIFLWWVFLILVVVAVLFLDDIDFDDWGF